MLRAVGLLNKTSGFVHSIPESGFESPHSLRGDRQQRLQLCRVLRRQAATRRCRRSLRANSLTGTLPTELGRVTELTKL